MQVAYCGEVLHVLQSTAQSVGEDRGPAEYAVGIQVLTGIYKVKIDSPPVAAVGLAQLDDPQVFPDRLGAVGGRPAEFQGIVQEVAVPGKEPWMTLLHQADLRGNTLRPILP